MAFGGGFFTLKMASRMAHSGSHSKCENLFRNDSFWKLILDPKIAFEISHFGRERVYKLVYGMAHFGREEVRKLASGVTHSRSCFQIQKQLLELVILEEKGCTN